MALSKVALLELSPSRWFRYFETGAVIACTGACALLAIEVARGAVAGGPGAWWMFAAAMGAYLLADLLAGVVHFVGDSFGAIDTPLVGLTFLLPFRSHHVHPEDICDHDFVATNGNNAFATLLLLVPTLLWMPVRDGGLWTAAGLFMLVLSALLMLTNQIHKWAHVAEPPMVVNWMQRVGLLLSAERHRVHHEPPYEGGYCVTSGVFNRLLDPIGFFPRLERAIRWALALAPRRR